MVLQQLLIPVITWSADISDFHFIFLDASRVSQVLSFDVMSVEIVCKLLWGRYLRVVMAALSAFGSDLPSIALIVLHSLEGSFLWSSVSMFFSVAWLLLW